MKPLFLFLVACFPLFIKADEKPALIKSWKTFKSELGFKFKYPGCWKVTDGQPSGKTPRNRNKDIMVNETGKCARAQMDSTTPNGVSFHVTERKTQSEQKTKQLFANIAQAAPFRAAAKPPTPTKLFKIGTHDAIAYVEGQKDFIRWQVMYDCPKSEINLTGPSIRPPQKSYLDKFKKGDLALPEPENTIIESVRCSGEM